MVRDKSRGSNSFTRSAKFSKNEEITASSIDLHPALAKPQIVLANSFGVNWSRPARVTAAAPMCGSRESPPPTRPYALATFASSFGFNKFATAAHFLSNAWLKSGDTRSPNRVSAQKAMVISYGLNVCSVVVSLGFLSPFPELESKDLSRGLSPAFEFVSKDFLSLGRSFSLSPKLCPSSNPQNPVAAPSSLFRSPGGIRRSKTANAHKTFATPWGSNSDACCVNSVSSDVQNLPPGSRSRRANDHVTLLALHGFRSGNRSIIRSSKLKYQPCVFKLPRSSSRTCLPSLLYAVATLITLKSFALSCRVTTSASSRNERVFARAAFTDLASSSDDRDRRSRPRPPPRVAEGRCGRLALAAVSAAAYALVLALGGLPPGAEVTGTGGVPSVSAPAISCSGRDGPFAPSRVTRLRLRTRVTCDRGASSGPEPPPARHRTHRALAAALAVGQRRSMPE